jgi:hypothetical protein
LKAGVVVKERRARMAVVGRAVGAAKRVRVVAGRRRREAKSLEAIVGGVVRVVDGRAQVVWIRES